MTRQRMRSVLGFKGSGDGGVGFCGVSCAIGWGHVRVGWLAVG